MQEPDGRVLDDLHAIILSRKGADPAQSYTAKLLRNGPAGIAKKVGEEAAETLIEAVGGSSARLAEESADLLYHLLVLWTAKEVAPVEVWRALERRKGVSGLVEKAGRGEDGA
jgi:phosphoribosyl-ATP pyrophosphohydrolase